MIAVPGPQPAARWGGRTLLHRGGWPTKPRAKSNRGGGGVDGKQTLCAASARGGLRSRGSRDCALLCPKSVLAARKAPGRLTVF